MSKSALKKYLSSLKKRELEIQILDLYERFPQVKTFYDFAFNPKEDKLIGDAKARISNEYFPRKRKRPRARRSVAQKYIRKFSTLGMDPYLLADLMLYNLETAQRFSAVRKVNEAFYKSMLRSYSEAVSHVILHSLENEFQNRMDHIYAQVREQDWGFADEFERIHSTTTLKEL